MNLRPVASPTLAPFIRCLLLLTGLLVALFQEGLQAQQARSELQDSGPLYVGTVRNRSWEENTTMKGIVVKLGTNDSDYVCYDEDLLRVSLLWTGAFMSFPNQARERIEHPQPPEVAGVTRFGTRPGPGWSHGGSFADPRQNHQGPLPRDWAHWTGTYLHGNHVILSYTVGGASVLELPDLETKGEASAFTRTLAIGPTTAPLALLVAESDTPNATTAGLTATGNAAPDSLEGNPAPVEASSPVAGVLYSRGEELTAIRMTAGPTGARWRVENGSRIVLDLPALTAPVTLKLLHWTGSRPNWKAFQALLAASPKPVDVAALTHGGPSRWNRTVETRGTVGTNQGPYQVDTLGEPSPNPWGTRNYLSGFDFFPDGRAAVAAFHGDVWIVGGLDGRLDKITWRRFATGLFQPLGLKIVNGVVHVTCRDALVRLTDLNGDGEADLYENVNNDTVVTPNYHEFCLDLQTDSAGNFYYAKGAPWPPDVKSPHQGTLLKVSREGSTLEVIATGLRAPNGLGMGPNDELTFSDNEGHYIPSSKISLVKPGNRFYGMAQTAHHPVTMDYEQPFVWIPKGMDNSSGGQAWVPDDRWGPLKGSMIFLSYGKASLFSVLQDRVGDVLQGGVVPFPFKFSSGVMRARFNPADGQLYVTGLRGWQTDGVRDGGFFRVRYTGHPVAWPVGFHARKDGVELRFSSPLSEESAKDVGNWAVDQWNYIYSANYGSPEVSTLDPRVRKHDPVEVAGVKVSDGGRTLLLQIPGIKPVMQMR
ncbi:MAG TPA: hypothetical protein DCM86_04070, partial [Verrucomicrobiales bacterium]|nr:hypothetical protein [Verrucomicrobiales bacterium]